MGADRIKPQPDFVIRLDGPGVKPWLVPMRTLSRVLGAVQRLVEQRDDLADTDEGDEPQGAAGTEARTLQLLAVKAGSAAYAVSSIDRDATLSILRETGQSLKAPDQAQWHPSTISSIDDLSQVARQLNCVIEFRSPKDGELDGDVIAVIHPETFSQIKERAFICGHTSVYGRLERVGGATAMKCGIHVRGRHRMLFCDVANSDLIRELGKHIYTDVVLSGQAVWYRFNRQLKSLTVSSFSPAKTEEFAEIARRIRDAGGSAWDKIPDPDAYIREMRG